MKKLLLPFLLPLAGFSVVKGYYWYQIKTAADELVQALSPFAVLEYGGVVAQFDGIAGIQNLRLTPHGTGVPVVIDAVILEASSWTDFAKMREQVDLPHRLAMSVKGLKIDPGSPPLAQLTTVTPNEALLGCPKAPGFGELMKALGYAELETDLQLGYTFNPASEFLTLGVDAAATDNFRLKASVDLDLGTTELSRSALSGVSPRFGGLELSYRDASFNERRNRYCAQLNNERVGDFIDRHVALVVDHYRDLGFQFGAPLEAAYRDFTANGGAFSLAIHAAEPLSATALAVYSPADLLQTMELKIAVNDRLVEPLELSWVRPTRAESLAKEEAQELPGEAELVVSTAEEDEDLPGVAAVAQPTTAAVRFEATAFQKPAPVAQPAFQPVAVTALGSHLGQRVRIHTRNGRQIEGVLLAQGNNGLRLRQKLGNGEAVLPITFQRIAAIEAFY